MAMSRSEFEWSAESFLLEQQVSVSILDDLLKCRLLDVSDDLISFEHETLFDYFRAEQLRRNYPTLDELSKELRRPRNEDLLEFIIPRFFDTESIAVLLSTAQSSDLLNLVLQGRCGERAKAVLESQCVALMRSAVADLPNLSVIIHSVEIQNGRRRISQIEVEHYRSWNSYDRLLCAVIAQNIDPDPIRAEFLALLDSSQEYLKSAAYSAAASARFKPQAVWSQTVRYYGGIFSQGEISLPCSAILADLKNTRMLSSDTQAASSIDSDLVERALTMEGHDLALCALTNQWRFSVNTIPIDTKLDLAQRGLESGIGMIQLGSMDLLHSMRREMDDANEAQMQRARDLLEGFETNDIMSNSLRLEILANYGGLELAVSEEDALAEMKALISPDGKPYEDLAELAELGEVSEEQFLRERAQSCIAKMFEDFFQGVYWDAYHALDGDERRKLLCLAAMGEKASSWSDWVLSELVKDGSPDALPMFRRWAYGIDPQSFAPQEAVASFLFGVQGCAMFEETPPPYREPISVDDRVWRTVEEILFWSFRGTNATEQSKRMDELWASFDGETHLAFADVLYQLAQSQWRLRDRRNLGRLDDRYPDKVRPLLESSLRQRVSLTSLFPYGGWKTPELVSFILSTLGEIGDTGSISSISELADDPRLGKYAIKAIEAIRRRM
jgi:hypothetical protein